MKWAEKHAGGQLRDQSQFENGTVWDKSSLNISK